MATVSGPTNRAPLVVLLVANAVSLVGSALTAVALPWFVLQTTGSAAQTGLTGLCVILPAFLMGVFGGAFVDRSPLKWVSVGEDVVSGIAVTLIPLLYNTVGLTFWQFLVLVFVASLFAVPGATARRAMLPELAALAGVRLERVNAAFEANLYVGSLLGPSLAGVLITVIGVSNVLWLDAATFAVSATLVIAAISTTVIQRTPKSVQGNYWKEIVEGFRFIQQDRLLLALAIGLGVANFFGLNPLFAVLLPVYAKTVYGNAAALGILVTAQGLGALLGAVAFGAFGHPLSRRVVWIVGFLVGPVRYWTLALLPPLPLMLAILVCGGVVSGLFNPLLSTLRHERTPTTVRGRVFGTFSAIASVASPFGIALTGFLTDSVGLRATVIVMAIGATIIGVRMVFIQSLRAVPHEDGVVD